MSPSTDPRSFARRAEIRPSQDDSGTFLGIATFILPAVGLVFLFLVASIMIRCFAPSLRARRRANERDGASAAARDEVVLKRPAMHDAWIAPASPPPPYWDEMVPLGVRLDDDESGTPSPPAQTHTSPRRTFIPRAFRRKVQTHEPAAPAPAADALDSTLRVAVLVALPSPRRANANDDYNLALGIAEVPWSRDEGEALRS
ncbi:hypothetical protein AURDEDRAFT_110342 [Auricularia subglabra TFB-10046 SS5]|nr:hypothetical protein AURDEDRAFT_110342 [Auricularia subglabra TFB-10046 SS5]